MKIFNITTWLSAFLLLCAVSCTEDPEVLGDGGYCTVSFLNCDDIEPVQVPTGTPVAEPATPATPADRAGYTFESWYSDPSYSMVWDFSTEVKNNMNLYAKWVDDNGDISPDDADAVEDAVMNDVNKVRPYIWTTNADREKLLSDIETYGWAQTVVTKMHNMVDANVNQHLLNPATILSTIPTIQTKDEFTTATTYAAAHGKILAPAGCAAALYHITRDKKYAVYATDILMYYLKELSSRPQSQISIGGEYFYDPRYTYNWIGVTYDFLYNYLNYVDADGNKRQYYDLNENKLVDYDNDVAQRALIKIARNTLDVETNGSAPADNHKNAGPNAIGVSNHPILTAPGSLYSILCVDDTYEQEGDEFNSKNYKRKDLFKLFWETGTKRQNSMSETILKKYSDQGVWPESTSYSFMPAVPQVLNMIDKIVSNEYNRDDNAQKQDRLFPGTENLFNKYSDCAKMMPGSVLFDYLRYPDRRFVRYGDSKRQLDGSDDLYRMILAISKRRPQFAEYGEMAAKGLAQRYAAVGYTPALSTTNDDGLSNLFWGVDVTPAAGGSDFDKTTINVEHAGVVLQRNYPETDKVMYGLCGIIGGANYVHNQASGIAMELYGCGYVMAGSGGLAANLDGRAEPKHIEYFQHYAGNNTVIIDSKSTGSERGSWNSANYLSQDDCTYFAAEPAHQANPINKNFNFATQELDDDINKCLQRRTLAILRTSPTTAYYLDVFRSKAANGVADHHDYIYHNLGTNVTFSDLDNNKTFGGADFVNTDFYSTSTSTHPAINDKEIPVRVPGWEDHFVPSTTKQLNEKKSSTLKARFDVAGKYMHMIMAGGSSRYYTKTTGPATREALKPFANTATQIVVIRHDDNVWDQPYFVTFEPSASESGSIQNVQPIQSGTKTVGVTVTSKVGAQIIVDMVLNLPDLDSTCTVGDIEFTGHYGVIRVTSTEGVDTKDVELYIGSGSKLKYKDLEITTTSTKGKKTKKWSAQTL